MIVDSSAIVAVARTEPSAIAILRALASQEAVRMAASVWFETTMVVSAKGLATRAQLASLAADARLEIVPFTDEHAAVALEAFERYGRGRHPARLNFGDCMSYATAKIAGEPLLYVGNDFARTDIESVL